MVSQNGYTFTLADQQAEPGRDVGVSFTIDGPDGKPVTAYDVEHEKRLHLIAVRRDFTGFQHVHPELSSTGVWSTNLDLTPGHWRLFADFKPTGAEALTLGTDLAVAGDYRPAASGDESRTAKVDGYTVTLDGDLTAGADAKLTLDVSRDGKPVTDLQPYLGAYGHLVALRGGDLAYLHVHPDGTPGDGTTEPGPGGRLLRRGAQRRHLPPVPGLPARRSGPHRGVHRPHRERPAPAREGGADADDHDGH